MQSLHPWPTFPPNLDPPIARSLSLQFILQELISSFELLDHLQTVTSEQLKGYDLIKEVAFISSELEKLVLFSLENPFAKKGGAFDKLCFYCHILLQASHINDPNIPIILEEMRNSVVRVKGMMIFWKKMPAFHPLDQILSHLGQLYSDLELKLRRLFNALSLYLQEARSDENVLLFLIENKEKLNTYLGASSIEELFVRFFPAGYSQLRAVICEGYTRRGFSSVFLTAEPLIDAIEWPLLKA